MVDENHHKKLTQTRGLSPSVTTWEEISQTLSEHVKPWCGDKTPEVLWFFGAGLGLLSAQDRMRQTLREVIGPIQSIKIETDLVGAAYACLGNNPGVVGILGTGSVAFRYENGEVVNRLGGWGHLLADEGGGVSLGRALLRGLLEHRLPANLLKNYEQFSGRNMQETIEALYQHPKPSLFLARQAPFLANHLDDEAVRNLIRSQISSFIHHYLAPLRKKEHDEIHFMGGVARIFYDLVREVSRESGLGHVKILKDAPIMSMARYLINQHLPV